MAFNWVSGFFIPIVEIVFIGVIGGGLLFIILRAIKKVWKRRLKWFLKHSVFRITTKPEDIQWLLDNEDLGYWEIKKKLMVDGDKRIDELLYLYNKILKSQGGKPNG